MSEDPWQRLAPPPSVAEGQRRTRTWVRFPSLGQNTRHAFMKGCPQEQNASVPVLSVEHEEQSFIRFCGINQMKYLTI